MMKRDAATMDDLALAMFWREQRYHFFKYAFGLFAVVFGDVAHIKVNRYAFFAYPPEIRKVIHTTNAIESVSFSLRKLITARASFPNDEAAIKLL
jgi:Transposase, Mutator family